jgi:hypothetical protein
VRDRDEVIFEGWGFKGLGLRRGDVRGFRVQGSGFRVCDGDEVIFEGSGFGVQGYGFRVWDRD